MLIDGIPGIAWTQLASKMCAGSDVGLHLAGVRVGAAVGLNASALLATLNSAMTLLVECTNDSAEVLHAPFQSALDDVWRVVESRPTPALRASLEKLVSRLRAEGGEKLRGCRLPSAR